MYVLDTDTVVSFFMGAGQVAKNLLAVPPHEIGIPSVVIYELQVELLRLPDPARRQDQLNEFLQAIKMLTFGLKEAETATEIRNCLENQGIPMGAHPVLIAATALADNHTLVTHNTNEYQKIEKLTLTDWY